MPNWIEEDFSKGQVNSKDPMELLPGEVQNAAGLYYKPNDKRLHVVPGRTAFGDTGSAAKVAGVKLCQFDNAADKLVALSGTTLHGATPGVSGTFANLKTGLTSGPELLSAAHYDDRWYLTNGLDRNMVLEDDGSVRNQGMDAQTEGFTATPAAGTGTRLRPTAPPSGVTDAAKTMDTDLETFGTMPLSSAGSLIGTFEGNEWTGAAATRQLIIKYALDNAGGVSQEWYGDERVRTREGAIVTIKFELSVDNGVTWTTVLDVTHSSARSATDFQYEVTADPDLVHVKVTYTYSSGTSSTALRIYDIRLQDGSEGAAISANSTVTYAVAEYDSTRGIQSLISPEVDAALVNASGHNQVTLDLFGYTPKNSNADYWIIYRRPAGSDSFGVISELPIAQTTFVDDFLTWGYFEQPTPVYEMLEYRSSETSTVVGSIREPLYGTPPTMTGIRSFKGHLVGWKDRAAFYSAPGLPEYWPASYTIVRFPLPEHDKLLDGADLGDYFVFACQSAMLRVEGLPIVLNGMFVPGEAKQIPGAPGCVGKKAMTTFSVSGQAFAAWISPYGVYATNGVTIEHLSQDWNWDDLLGFDKSKWVLHWDPERAILYLAYSSTASGENDRYAMLHMHPSRIKAGRPTITWGHYGALNDLAHGQVGNRRRLYSAHPSNGIVYLEDYGTTDASNTYDSDGNIPFTLQLRRMQGNASDWSALGVRLGHTDFGTGESATVAWKYGRDNSSRTVEETKQTTVSLAGHKRTLFDIGRGGEWHEPTFSWVGKASGAVLDMQMRARPLGAAGKVSVA